MTREEAKARFKVLLKDEYAFNSADREAFAMAIKALEHPERNVVAIVPCGDAISRQAVLDKKELVELEDGQSFYCISPEDVETLPPVNPQPKTGHCKECKYFEYDSIAMVDEIPLIVAHEMCARWGDGCKTSEDGYCFLFAPQESEVSDADSN